MSESRGIFEKSAKILQFLCDKDSNLTRYKNGAYISVLVFFLMLNVLPYSLNHVYICVFFFFSDKSLKGYIGTYTKIYADRPFKIKLFTLCN